MIAMSSSSNSSVAFVPVTAAAVGGPARVGISGPDMGHPGGGGPPPTAAPQDPRLLRVTQPPPPMAVESVAPAPHHPFAERNFAGTGGSGEVQPPIVTTSYWDCQRPTQDLFPPQLGRGDTVGASPCPPMPAPTTSTSSHSTHQAAVAAAASACSAPAATGLGETAALAVDGGAGSVAAVTARGGSVGGSPVARSQLMAQPAPLQPAALAAIDTAPDVGEDPWAAERAFLATIMPRSQPLVTAAAAATTDQWSVDLERLGRWRRRLQRKQQQRHQRQQQRRQQRQPMTSLGMPNAPRAVDVPVPVFSLGSFRQAADTPRDQNAAVEAAQQVDSPFSSPLDMNRAGNYMAAMVKLLPSAAPAA